MKRYRGAITLVAVLAVLLLAGCVHGRGVTSADVTYTYSTWPHGVWYPYWSYPHYSIYFHDRDEGHYRPYRRGRDHERHERHESYSHHERYESHGHHESRDHHGGLFHR